MNLRFIVRVAAAACVASLLPAVAFAQRDLAQIRGTVLDDKGQPIPGVAIELKYEGETRVPIIKNTSSDKKGGFVRVGLKAGKWALTFTKEGYRTVAAETDLAMNELAIMPPVTMPPSAPAVPPAAAAAAAAAAASEEHAKQLGEAYMKALASLQAGQDADAETQFKAIVGELPELAEAHYNLGYLYEKRGALAEAEASFRKAFELQPQNAAALVAQATLANKRGASEDALALLESNAPRFEDNARVQFALGAVAFNLGRNQVAEPAFEKAAALDPSNAETLFFLGSIAVGRNDVPAALARLDKFVATAEPSSPNLDTAKGLLATLRKKK